MLLPAEFSGSDVLFDLGCAVGVHGGAVQVVVQRGTGGVELILDGVRFHAGQQVVHAVQILDGVGLERVDLAGDENRRAQVDGRPVVHTGGIQRVGQVVVLVAAVAAQIAGRVQLGCGVVDGLAGVHRAAHGGHCLGHVGHGGGVQGAAGRSLGSGSLVQLGHAALCCGHDGGLLVVIRHRVGGVVDQRELDGLDVVAVVVDVVGVLGVSHGACAVGTVSHLQQDFGLLGVEQVGLHAGLADTVGGVQVTVGAPQAVRSLGGLGGGSVVQHAVLLGKLLFHGSIVLNGAGRQLGNVVTADGGDILTVDRAGAGGLQHGLDVGRGLAGGQLRNTGGGVVGVVLGQQIDACRDLDPADGADGGRRGHGTASQRQHHGNSHSKAEQFGFNGTHELVLPFMIGFAAQRRSINAIIPHFCRYCKPRGGVIYL